jgi:hypothetical protein
VSLVNLYALVGRARSAMHHPEFVRQSEQAFRVPDKKVSVRIQTAVELLY